MTLKSLTNQETTKQDVEEAKAYLEKLDAFDYKFKIGEYYLQQMAFQITDQPLHHSCKQRSNEDKFQRTSNTTCSKKLDNYADKIVRVL